MDKPCEHCNKADKSKQDYFKCGNPCTHAKQCYENDKKLLDALRGRMPDIEKVLQRNGGK